MQRFEGMLCSIPLYRRDLTIFGMHMGPGNDSQKIPRDDWKVKHTQTFERRGIDTANLWVVQGSTASP